MEDELRRRLEDAADAFYLSERAPVGVLGRAKIRIALTAGLAAATIVAFSTGAFYGISAFADRGTTNHPVEAPSQSPTEEGHATTCEGVDGVITEIPNTYRTKGRELTGNVDGRAGADHVTMRIDKARPERCRYLVVVEISGGATVGAVLAPLDWPGSNPKLLLLAEVDGRPGVEPVVELAPANVYRPGAVYTMLDGALARMRLEGRLHGDLFPFYDEFPAGSDCAEEPGTIVASFSSLAKGGDSQWDLTRTFYRAAGDRFERVRAEKHLVEVGPASELPWLELRGDPFVSCPDLIR